MERRKAAFQLTWRMDYGNLRLMNEIQRIRYIRTLRMPIGPRSVLYTLASHGDKHGSCYLLQSTIADESSLSVRAVYSAIRYLSANGLLIHVRHGHQASTFQLTIEAFKLARQSAPRAERNRQYVPTEVTTPKKRKKRNDPTPGNVVRMFPEAKGLAFPD